MQHKTINCRSRNKNQSGFVLIFFMVVLLILTLAGITNMMVTRSGIRVTGNFTKAVDAYNAAFSAQQMGQLFLDDYIESGGADFDLILAQSASNYHHSDYGYILNMDLTCRTCEDDQENIQLGEATYTLYIANNLVSYFDGLDPSAEDPTGSNTNDGDRIVILTAVSNVKGAEVVLRSFLGSLDNTIKIPTPVGPGVFAGTDTIVDVGDDTYIGGYHWDLPSTFDCFTSGGDNGCDGTIDLAKSPASAAVNYDFHPGSNLTIGAAAILDAPAPTKLDWDSSLQGDKWLTVIDQILTSGSYDYVTGNDVCDRTFGNRAEPKITVIDSVSSTQPINLCGETHGAGLMIVIADQANFKDDFHYEGVVAVVHDGHVKFEAKEGNIFGAFVATESGPDTVPKLQLEAQPGATPADTVGNAADGSAGPYIKINDTAIGYADQAIANALGVVVIGWFEDF